MKFVQITESCDMTRADTGEHVPADETLYIAIGTDHRHLKIRELDLTQEWAKSLREALAPFIDASHEPGEIGTPGSGQGKGGSNLSRARAYNQARIAWAKANGYNLTPLAKGGYYPPVKTKKAYAHFLAGEDHLLTEEHKLQPDYDPVTGNPA